MDMSIIQMRPYDYEEDPYEDGYGYEGTGEEDESLDIAEEALRSLERSLEEARTSYPPDSWQRIRAGACARIQAGVYEIMKGER